MPRSKDRLPLKELSINSFSWSGLADSHFVDSFCHKCVVLNYQPGWPSSAAWFEWGGGGGGGGLCTKSRMFGKSCEVKGQVSGTPYNIQEPSSNLIIEKLGINK